MSNTERKCGCKGKKNPNLAKQMSNAGKAIVRVAGAMINGDQVIASPIDKANRIAICRKCESMQGNRCIECGCFLIAKIRLNTEKCPLEKW